MRVIFFLPIIPAIIQIFCLLYIFKEESPKYYIINQKFEKAKNLIEKICQNNSDSENDDNLESFLD